MAACPQCGGEIQATWDWCQHCGFDPDGTRPPGAPLVGPSPAGLAYVPPSFAPPTGGPVPSPAPSGPVYVPPSFAPPSSGSPSSGPPAYAPPGYGPAGYGPPAYAPPGYGPPGYGPPAYAPPPPSSSGATALKVLGGIALTFVVLIAVCILAVTLLGRNPSSRISSSGNPSAGVPPVTTAPIWTTWTAPDGTFSVAFPGVPTVAPIGPNDPKFKTATQASTGGATDYYGVAWFEPAAGFTIADSTVMLNAVTDGAAQGASWTLTRRELGDFAGNPAIFLDGATAAGQMQGLAIISGQRVYLFLAIAAPGTPNEFVRFRDSFHIL